MNLRVAKEWPDVPECPNVQKIFGTLFLSQFLEMHDNVTSILRCLIIRYDDAHMNKKYIKNTVHICLKFL